MRPYSSWPLRFIYDLHNDDIRSMYRGVLRVDGVPRLGISHRAIWWITRNFSRLRGSCRRLFRSRTTGSCSSCFILFGDGGLEDTCFYQEIVFRLFMQLRYIVFASNCDGFTIFEEVQFWLIIVIFMGWFDKAALADIQKVYMRRTWWLPWFDA